MRIEHFNEDDFERIFVFGDLHGRIDLFEAMLKKINFTRYDLLVILGDSRDKRKDDIRIYMKFRRLLDEGYNLKHVLGNHEQIMVDCYYGRQINKYNSHSIWLRENQSKNLEAMCKRKSNRKEIIWLMNYIESMPHILVSDESIYVHAAYDFGLELSEQDENFIIWSRAPFWHENDSGKEVYYGHTPNKDNEIHLRQNSVYSMDVGAFYYGRLVIMEKKSKEIFEVGKKHCKAGKLR